MNSRGSLTVEAAIVTSTVLFILFFLIQGTMLLYQKALLTYTASKASQQGAMVWNDSRRELTNGAWDNSKERDPLYYRLLNDSLFGYNSSSFKNPYIEKATSAEDIKKKMDEALQVIKNGDEGLENRKFARIRSEIYGNLNRFILKPRETEIRIEYRNIFIKRTISVGITQEYPLPFAGLAVLFGGKGTIKLEAYSEATVAEQAEFIRNVDLGLEYFKRMGRKFDVVRVFDDIRKKVQGN